MKALQETERMEAIAIVGMACRFPGASNVDRFWQNLCNGVESVTTFTDAQLLAVGVAPPLLKADNYVKAGILLDGVEMFDANFFGFTPREAELMDPQHRIFLECAWEALETAGYNADVYPGRIGIYAGAGINDYFSHNLISNPELIGSLTDLQRLISVDKDFLATRAAYKLNLKGPAMTVQTACSTSLVAVHLACQSLLNGECDMVLAGGSSIRVPQVAGYLYHEGSIASRDGHCRAFDAAAQGIVIGSGAGLVVLKRLADALSDGDTIHAVIRSTAVNNDGSAKAGYTAPGVEGQSVVIAEAQALAGLTADSITYVEAHGTGTALGDPIEVAALTAAFRRTTQKKDFCAIGSLKPNIGHLDTAAGVAGVIKVALALEHRMIPPSLNFEQANPAIDFAGSPFHVARTLSDWAPETGRRLAGVSSFGIGGTNAHAVMAEAPAVAASPEAVPWQLLTLSAKTAAALDAATGNLADFLASHPEANLADVAFTLHRGRKVFTHRRALAVRNIDDAVQVLRSRNASRICTRKAQQEEAGAVFLFPAQGAQYVNMGRELYDSEPVFREEVDRCAAHLHAPLGLNLVDLLYPKEGDAEAASEQLRQTRFTQPAVFTIDHALARLWMSWGVVPVAMVGHSLGEYVAATLAGVFELEEALALVVDRARLMQAQPPGSMLAVHLSEGDVQRWMTDAISLAAVNAPGLSVLSGDPDAIARLTESLKAEGIEGQLLRTSHAFHSAMMEPVVVPLVERVRLSPRHAPRIPVVSTLTGKWVTADEITDPAYWGRQLRNAVRFSPAVVELLKSPGRVFLEVGPGNTLSALAKLHLAGNVPSAAFSSLRHVKETRPDRECMLTALGGLWSTGVPVDWPRFHARVERRRIPLPTYPFERKRYWIEAKQVAFSSHETCSPQGEVSAESTSMTLVDKKDGEMASSGHSRPDLACAYAAPQTPTEKALARVWQDLLGIEEVGIRDSFFDLGGHSLLATQVVARLRQVFRMDLPQNSLFDAPTIAQLAVHMIAHEFRPGLVERTAGVLNRIHGMTEEEVEQSLRGQAAGHE